MNTSQHSRGRGRGRGRGLTLSFSQKKATDFDPCEICDTAAFKTKINLKEEYCLLTINLTNPKNDCFLKEYFSL